MPPGRFSTTIGWPRMKMSLIPPALVVVMALIGRAG
jgi:hypothetical protein